MNFEELLNRPADRPLQYLFGLHHLKKLIEFDKEVFSVRNDLQLHVWTIMDREGRRIYPEELNVLSSLKNIRNLYISGFSNTALPEIGRMSQLEQLRIVHYLRPLELNFLETLINLRKVYFTGRYSHWESLSQCKNVEAVHFDIVTLPNVEFLSSLEKLTSLEIESSHIEKNFDLSVLPGLKNLTLVSLKKWKDASFLSKLANLEKLTLVSQDIKVLPDLSGLRQLTEISLSMNKLENPEIIVTLPNLKKLELKEVNKKLSPEQYSFLNNMNLEELKLSKMVTSQLKNVLTIPFMEE